MEKKIDKRVNYRLVIDTETCPVDKDLQEVLPSNMWTYDIGWAIVDKRGKVYKTRSFVNADIFLAEKELMNSGNKSSRAKEYLPHGMQSKRH